MDEPSFQGLHNACSMMVGRLKPFHCDFVGQCK